MVLDSSTLTLIVFKSIHKNIFATEHGKRKFVSRENSSKLGPYTFNDQTYSQFFRYFFTKYLVKEKVFIRI